MMGNALGFEEWRPPSLRRFGAFQVGTSVLDHRRVHNCGVIGEAAFLVRAECSR